MRSGKRRGVNTEESKTEKETPELFPESLGDDDSNSDEDEEQLKLDSESDEVSLYEGF